jgi:hypothetical protein
MNGPNHYVRILSDTAHRVPFDKSEGVVKRHFRSAA